MGRLGVRLGTRRLPLDTQTIAWLRTNASDWGPGVGVRCTRTWGLAPTPWAIALEHPGGWGYEGGLLLYALAPDGAVIPPPPPSGRAGCTHALRLVFSAFGFLRCLCAFRPSDITASVRVPVFDGPPEVRKRLRRSALLLHLAPALASLSLLQHELRPRRGVSHCPLADKF